MLLHYIIIILSFGLSVTSYTLPGSVPVSTKGLYVYYPPQISYLSTIPPPPLCLPANGTEITTKTAVIGVWKKNLSYYSTNGFIIRRRFVKTACTEYVFGGKSYVVMEKGYEETLTLNDDEKQWINDLEDVSKLGQIFNKEVPEIYECHWTGETIKYTTYLEVTIANFQWSEDGGIEVPFSASSCSPFNTTYCEVNAGMHYKFLTVQERRSCDYNLYRQWPGTISVNTETYTGFVRVMVPSQKLLFWYTDYKNISSSQVCTKGGLSIHETRGSYLLSFSTQGGQDLASVPFAKWSSVSTDMITLFKNQHSKFLSSSYSFNMIREDFKKYLKEHPSEKNKLDAFELLTLDMGKSHRPRRSLLTKEDIRYAQTKSYDWRKNNVVRLNELNLLKEDFLNVWCEENECPSSDMTKDHIERRKRDVENALSSSDGFSNDHHDIVVSNGQEGDNNPISDGVEGFEEKQKTSSLSPKSLNENEDEKTVKQDREEYRSLNMTQKIDEISKLSSNITSFSDSLISIELQLNIFLSYLNCNCSIDEDYGWVTNFLGYKAAVEWLNVQGQYCMASCPTVDAIADYWREKAETVNKIQNWGFNVTRTKRSLHVDQDYYSDYLDTNSLNMEFDDAQLQWGLSMLTEMTQEAIDRVEQEICQNLQVLWVSAWGLRKNFPDIMASLITRNPYARGQTIGQLILINEGIFIPASKIIFTNTICDSFWKVQVLLNSTAFYDDMWLESTSGQLYNFTTIHPNCSTTPNSFVINLIGGSYIDLLSQQNFAGLGIQNIYLDPTAFSFGNNPLYVHKDYGHPVNVAPSVDEASVPMTKTDDYTSWVRDIGHWIVDKWNSFTDAIQDCITIIGVVVILYFLISIIIQIYFAPGENMREKVKYTRSNLKIV